MTGNSLDAIDTVISIFSPPHGICDIQHHSAPFPLELADQIRAFKDALRESDGDLALAEQRLAPRVSLSALHDRYVELVAQACTSTIETARAAKTIAYDRSPDLIGFHGQTCAHLPPSIAQKSGIAPYTIQMGDGQVLANLVNIPVAYDFRSDDILNGGEGAPLAPMHHLHLALACRSQGALPIAFVNAGNTANVSVITTRGGAQLPDLLGWDAGPFNHLPDFLARREAGRTHDENGEIGLAGRVNESLLRVLFEKSAINEEGGNFLTTIPPRSSDPQWYREVPELLGEAPVDGVILALADRMRTAEYFSAYVVMYALSFLPTDYDFPRVFALCGGGWKNPVTLQHFRNLLSLESDSLILKEHQAVYDSLIGRLGNYTPIIEFSSAFGFDSTSMEARIFADAAAQLVWGEPFTVPSVTGVQKPTVCGRIRFPASQKAQDFVVGRYMDEAGTLQGRSSREGFVDPRFGRAIRAR